MSPTTETNPEEAGTEGEVQGPSYAHLHRRAGLPGNRCDKPRPKDLIPLLLKTQGIYKNNSTIISAVQTRMLSPTSGKSQVPV